MTCVIRSLSFMAALPIAVLLSAAAPASSLGAQAPVSPGSMPATLAPYRAPFIALVQPAAVAGTAAGGFVPQDRPVVVFRFAAGEADDPLDVRSFMVAVDGVDRTTLFQTTMGQAWGPLAGGESVARGQLAAGTHRVVARICSTRGACSAVESQVLVVPGPTNAAPSEKAGSESTRRRLMGAVLSATRRLLLP